MFRSHSFITPLIPKALARLRQSSHSVRMAVLAGSCLIALAGLTLHTAEATGGTTRYVNSSGNCSGNSPCYTSMKNAILASGNTDIIDVMASLTEGDLVGNFTPTNITIQSFNSASPVTVTGSTNLNFTASDDWTIQNINFTQDLFAQNAPGGWTINNVHAVHIIIGSEAQGTIGGNITIENCTLDGSTGVTGSQISILGGDGKTVNGTIKILNNTNLAYINVFSYVASSSSSTDLAANITIDSNHTIQGMNIGVNYLGSNIGHGNITGSVTITNNTVTDLSKVIGVTINAKDANGDGGDVAGIYGDIDGPVNVSNNVSPAISVITIDENAGNINGNVTVAGNTLSSVEVSANGGLNGAVSIHDNEVYYQGPNTFTGDSFITAFCFANTAGTGSVDIENNDLNLPSGRQYPNTTGIIFQAKNGDNNDPVTINNNVAYHAIYQIYGTNQAPFTITNNVISGVNPKQSNDDYITVQSDTSTIQNGTISGNTAVNLQTTIQTSLAGTLTVSNNTFSTLTSILTKGSTVGNGVAYLTGNRTSHLYVYGLNAQVHYNSILGQFDTNTSPVLVDATENWWGCNLGYQNSSPCQSGTFKNGGNLEPHLTASLAVTCTSQYNAGVAFNLDLDSSSALQLSNVAPAIASISSSIGSVGASAVALRNGAGSTAVGLGTAGGSPTVNVKIDSQTLTSSATCNTSSTRPDTIGVYRNGVFLLRNSNTTGANDLTVYFSYGSSPLPITGDWTGGGIDTVGDYSQASGVYYVRDSNTSGGPDAAFVLGNPNDEPLAGRWMLSDTHDGAGVFRPTNGLIYLKNQLTSGYADAVMVLGSPGDDGLANDWAGSGIDSPGVFRPSSAVFFATTQVCNCVVYSDYNVSFGAGTDLPFTGDWSGVGYAGIGVFRPGTDAMFLHNTLIGGSPDYVLSYGSSGDLPVAGHWVAPGSVPAHPNRQPNLLVTPTSAPPGSSVQAGNTIGG